MAGTAVLSDQAGLDRFVELAVAAGRFGVDTEFMSEGRYRTQLCLVQVVVDDPSGGFCVELFDPLAGDLDFSGLADLLADPAVEVVLHAGRQDVALLRRVWEVDVCAVFDTQVAAGFVGLGSQIGYANLLAKLLSVQLEKSASFTRWDLRPLTDEQLLYAAEDVNQLLEVADLIQASLLEVGRLEWAREECKAVAEASDHRDPYEVYLRLPRVNRLSGRAVAVARELAAWREDLAQRADRPASNILPDVVLMELAKRRPKSREIMSQIRGLAPGVVKHRFAELVEAIVRGEAAPELKLKRPNQVDSKPGDAALISLCEAVVRDRVMREQIAYELVASRADLELVVRHFRVGLQEPSVRTLIGWRRELVGSELLALLAGEVVLSVGRDATLAVDRVVS